MARVLELVLQTAVKMLSSLRYFKYYLLVVVDQLCLQCFDAVGWASGRASGL